MSLISLEGGWLALLPKNRYGLSVLTLPVAWKLAREFPSGWYVAPYATKWTVGKATASGESFHLLDGNGEPLSFETILDAQQFLLRELSVTCEILPRGADRIRADEALEHA